MRPRCFEKSIVMMSVNIIWGCFEINKHSLVLYLTPKNTHTHTLHDELFLFKVWALYVHIILEHSQWIYPIWMLKWVLYVHIILFIYKYIIPFFFSFFRQNYTFFL